MFSACPKMVLHSIRTLFACNSFWRFGFSVVRGRIFALLFASLALNMIITALLFVVASLSHFFAARLKCDANNSRSILQAHFVFAVANVIAFLVHMITYDAHEKRDKFVHSLNNKHCLKPNIGSVTDEKWEISELRATYTIVIVIDVNRKFVHRFHGSRSQLMTLNMKQMRCSSCSSTQGWRESHTF